VYSFGLNAEEHQPSGTCNMSRIDNAQLVYRLSDNTLCPAYHTTTSPYGAVFSSSATGTLKVYAVNYNVLRINYIVLKSILLVTFLALLREKQLVSKGCSVAPKAGKAQSKALCEYYRQMLVKCNPCQRQGKLCDIPRGGNFLRAFATTLMGKLIGGPRLIAVPNGKNAKDWMIRHREPKDDMGVQGSGSTTAKVWV